MPAIRQAMQKWLGITARDAQISALMQQNMRLRQKLSKTRTASGVDLTWGKFEYDTNQDFYGTKGIGIYDEMENDAHVKESLRVNTLPLVTAEWSVKPASDDPRDEEIAEFVGANLLRAPSETFGPEYWCQTSWKAQRLPEILDMLRVGRSLFAKSKRSVKGRWVYDRLQWLEPSSIDDSQGWILDGTDQIVEVRRTYDRPTGDGGVDYRYVETLKADKLALYTWDMKGARYPGRSFLRSMYGPWKRKDIIARLAVIFAQKVGAPAPMGIYPAGWSPDDVDRFDEFVESLTGLSPSEIHASFPRGTNDQAPEVHYAGSEVEQVDRMRGLLDGENAEIAHAGGTKSGLLGETASGSRALGGTQQAMETLLIRAVAEVVCAWETHGVGNLKGLVEELVDWNYGNVNAYPELVVSKIDPMGETSKVDRLVPAYSAGLVPKHESVRRQVSQWFGLELPDEAYEIEEVPVPLPNNEPPGDTSPDNTPPADTDGDGDGDDNDEREMALAAREDFRKRIAPLLVPMEDAPSQGAGFRRPNQLESDVCNLATINEAFRVGETAVHNTLRGVRQLMRDELLGWHRSGKLTTRNLTGLRKANFKKQKRSEAAMVQALGDVAAVGIVHVQDEV